MNLPTCSAVTTTSVFCAPTSRCIHATSKTPRRVTLLAVVDRRLKELGRRALKLGRDVYKRRPKRFVGEIERGWRKRVQVS